MALQSNQIVGNYRIVRPLGKGGMAMVYEVEHVKLGVHYALKTFTFEGGHDELLKNKFLAEGKVLALRGEGRDGGVALGWGQLGGRNSPRWNPREGWQMLDPQEEWRQRYRIFFTLPPCHPEG